MAQAPAHSDQHILETGRLMRLRGEEPTRASLYNALGKTGHSKRLWDVWLAFRDGNGARVLPLDVTGETPATPEMRAAATKLENSLAAMLDLAREEAAAPLRVQVDGMREALLRLSRDNQQQEQLIDALHSQVDALLAENACLKGAPSTPGPRLILP